MSNRRTAEIAQTTLYLLRSISVDKWTLRELRAQAKVNGLTGYRKLSKQDLYDAIMAKVSGHGDPSTPA